MSNGVTAPIDPTLFTTTIVCSYGGQFDNCYVTLEEANAYLAGRELAWGMSLWKALMAVPNTPVQSALLIAASQDIDAVNRWTYDKFFYWQSMEFPRYTNIEGWFPSTGLPDPSYYDYIQQDIEQLEMVRRVKKATCEQAYWILRQKGPSDDLERMAMGIDRYTQSIGPIHESFGYRPGGQILCREALGYLKIYLSMPLLTRR